MKQLAFALAAAALFPLAVSAAEPRNPRVNQKTYNDCRRNPSLCAGDDRNRARRDYYRDNRRQGSGQYIYRGQRRIWTEESR
ncbi:hypothetical protein [Rhizobium binxianense]